MMTRVMNKLNQVELAVIEGAGHLPYEEMPQAFNELALRFLHVNGNDDLATKAPPRDCSKLNPAS